MLGEAKEEKKKRRKVAESSAERGWGGTDPSGNGFLPPHPSSCSLSLPCSDIFFYYYLFKFFCLAWWFSSLLIFFKGLLHPPSPRGIWRFPPAGREGGKRRKKTPNRAPWESGGSPHPCDVTPKSASPQNFGWSGGNLHLSPRCWSAAGPGFCPQTGSRSRPRSRGSTRRGTGDF